METIDIIIPVFNEERDLENLIKRIEEVDFCGLKKNLIFVNDGSSDSSADILAKYPQYTIINHDKNRGKGAALATGLKSVKSDIVVIQDGDMEYDPKDYQSILPLIINNEADVVYGSRLKTKDSRQSFLFFSYAANIFLTWLTNILYGCKITDMETCYKAFRRNVLDDIEIKAQRYDFEVEITAKVIKKGFKIKEVPISYKGRTYSEGKKISWRDGLHAVFALFYYRFFN